ncbi:M10 family metallopeptidase [Rhizobium sp.]
MCNSFGVVPATGNEAIDGLLSGTFWDGPVTYAFPQSAAQYAYDGESTTEFMRANNLQKKATLFALDMEAGNRADDGFSIEGFTGINISLGSDPVNANIRAAQSALPSTAWAYLPGGDEQAGDVWLGIYGNVALPKAGNYAWQTVMHEMGHAVGLKHGHEGLNGFGVLPSNYDTLEKSIMTYRTFEGGATTGYTYEHWGAPQTFMMADIAALQYMYGADFETNSDDTVYSWRQGQGDTWVNGSRAIDAGGKIIFATIWDGGGIDTYDLSGFKSRLNINLEPGEASVFNDGQLSNLGRGHKASGNIYNALQYQGDARSLIENAIGGKGADTITGNAADNRLVGGKNSDKLYGHDGNDTLVGGQGRDYLSGDAGNDILYGRRDNDKLYGGPGDDTLYGGHGADTFIFKGDAGNDTIMDFRNGQDKIAIYTEATVDIAKIIAEAVQIDNDVLITISDIETVTLRNFSLAQLDSRDFLV